LLVANHANTGKWTVFRKDYLEGSSLYTKCKAIWLENVMNHENGKEEITKLFGFAPFDFPKSVEYVEKCIELGSKEESIVLDFFSGSSTTAHSVMKLNAKDGKNRQFIMIQLPEKCETGSIPKEKGYDTICEIGKERIRRAGKQISSSSQSKLPGFEKNLDVGFRVFKLDSSNMKDVYYSPSETPKVTLDGFIDNIKSDRTHEDLLFQVMLDLNIELSAPVERLNIAGKEVFSVDNGYLMACFMDNVSNEVVTEIAKRHPYHFVTRDNSMVNDSVATNFDQIFKAYSPDTIRSVL